MACPTCNTHFQTTDVRCIQCGTLLIETAVKRSDAYNNGARFVDMAIYSGIGSVLVGVPAGFLLQSGEASALGAAIGAVIGGIIARKKYE